MDDEGFDDYDRELELALYKEYRDVVSQFVRDRESGASTSRTT
jgi:hypothetical protein